MKKISSQIFVVNALFHVALILWDESVAQTHHKFYVAYIISRLLLMPLLAMAVIPCIYHNNKKLFPYISWALFFSWAGDFMLSFKGELYFVIGLSSFLLAHVSYIFFYKKETEFSKRQILKEKKWLVFPFVVLVGLFIYFTAPNLKQLLIPVFCYSLILCGMALMAIQRKGNVSNPSFYFTAIGALLFVFSDLLIGLNAFYYPLPKSQLIIMSTYIAGQYLIGKGLCLHATSKG